MARWWSRGRQGVGSDCQPSDGTKARIEAERDLERVIEQRDVVRRVSDSLRDLREEENHFADRISYMIRGGIG